MRQIAEDVEHWDFDVFSYSSAELMAVVLGIFRKNNLLSLYNIDEGRLTLTLLGTLLVKLYACIELFKDFIVAVKIHYHGNSYHNIQHAVDVLQSTYYLLKESALDKQTLVHFDSLDQLALLLAAYGHDIGHPGCNNSFMNTTQTSLASLYHGQSVLENLHVALLFELLKKYPVLQGLAVATQNYIKAFVKQSILATDMALHFMYIEKLWPLTRATATGTAAFTTEEKQLLGCCFIKAADLCNTARPFSIHSKSVDCLIQEYRHQGDTEKSLGFHESPMVNLAPETKPIDQLHFFDTFVEPLYQPLAQICPSFKTALLSRLLSNRAVWHQQRISMSHA